MDVNRNHDHAEHHAKRGVYLGQLGAGLPHAEGVYMVAKVKLETGRKPATGYASLTRGFFYLINLSNMS